MFLLFVFLGKYGRQAGLPFLRPPLTTALLTLGKAQQVPITSTPVWHFICLFVFVMLSLTTSVCVTEGYAWKWTSPPEPFAYAARTAAAPAHQRQTHQQCKTTLFLCVCVFLSMLHIEDQS